MTSVRIALLTAVATIATTAVAQEFQLRQELPGQGYEEAPSSTVLPTGSRLTPQVQVNRTEILFDGEPPAYGIDQWATGEVAAALEAPEELRMFVDKPNPYRDHSCNGCVCFGCCCIVDPTVLVVHRPSFERYTQLYYVGTVGESPRRNRYEGKPTSSADFIVVDYASSTHLGLVGPPGPQ